jgi:dipeptidyl aminopeptidase/acylaminoacyl peptidase
MVVMVHGGPVVRDHWKWTDEVHLLATHGYVVFQPQFRGSSGFGKKFEELGYRQWGRAMQDDITQGVRQLIKDGVADPNRICIVGWSYGGYAALWGLVQTPELYRCGVSGAGVADISYMLSDYSDTNETKEGRLMMVKLVGLKSDAASFDAVSPLKQAARIKAPVMLVHGDLDRRVPIAHGRKMRDALEDSGQKVEWLTFENEGHGLRYTKSQKRYYESLLNFLHKHIGGMAPRVSEPKPEKKP